MDRGQFFARQRAEAFLQSEHELRLELQKQIDKAIELLKNNADREEVIKVLERR